MKLIAISDYLSNKIEKQYKNANIINLGNIDVTNNMIMNELHNMTMSSEIYSFTADQLESNNFNTKSHCERIFELNKKYMLIEDEKSIKQIKNKIKNLPYKINFNSTTTNDIQDIKNYYQTDYKPLYFRDLFHYTSNGVGKGELFLGLLTQMKKTDDAGDLNLKGKHIEIKADKSRFKYINGYGSIRITWKIFKQFLKDNSKNPKKLSLNDPNKWNLNKKSIQWVLKELNNLVKTNCIIYENIKQLFKKIFKTIFLDITNIMLNKYINKFIIYLKEEKGQKFLDLFLILQFDYYQYITKFDILILMNENKYLIIHSAFDLKDKIKFISYSGFSWKEDRNCVFSISLKK